MNGTNIGGAPVGSGPQAPPTTPPAQAPVQPPVQPPAQPQAPRTAQKWPWYVVAVIVIVVIAFGIWWWMRGPVEVPPSVGGLAVPVAPAPTPAPAAEPDTTGAITNDLDQIDVGDMDFQAIDQDINQL